MRCKSCDIRLTSFESTRKYLDGDYCDLCNRCFKASGYIGEVKVRRDLKGAPDEFEVDKESE